MKLIIMLQTIVPNSLEFYIILGSTLFILTLKAVVVIYLYRKIQEKKKQDIKPGLDFIRGVMIFILALFISRIFYMIFDFGYTKFDMTLYATKPAVWFWKLGSFIAGLGITYVVYVVDRYVLQNKYKTIPAIIMLLGSVMVLLWPINTLDDFTLVSLLFIIPQLGMIFVPVIFIKIAVNSTGILRKTSFAIVLAIILYAIGALLVNASVIDYVNTKVGADMDMYFYLIRALLKSIGIVLFAYSSKNFRI